MYVLYTLIIHRQKALHTHVREGEREGREGREGSKGGRGGRGGREAGEGGRDSTQREYMYKWKYMTMSFQVFVI